MPDFFQAALAQPANRAAAEGFAGLAPSYRREYLVWLASAKRPETRADRLRKTLEALRRGRKWADQRAQ
jgi:uncharacterized protein YdeI (YjbR/CyaY-like superfamily)